MKCAAAGTVRSDRDRAIGWRAKTDAEIEATLVGLVDRVTRRIRAAGRVGRTVMLRLRFDDSTRATRSHTFDGATAHTATILEAARDLLAGARPLIEHDGITLIGISVGNLDNDDHVQLTLPFTRRGSPSIDTALDDVRTKFGSAAVTRGAARS